MSMRTQSSCSTARPRLVACVGSGEAKCADGVECHRVSEVAGKVVAREAHQKNARLVKEMKNVAHLSYSGYY